MVEVKVLKDWKRLVGILGLFPATMTTAMVSPMARPTPKMTPDITPEDIQHSKNLLDGFVPPGERSGTI